MEKYRSLYNKLKNEIEMLKKELSEEEKECFERQEKFKKTMLYKMNLEDELSDLKDKKEDDIKNNKKRISSIFDYIYSSFVTITFIAGVAISAYYMVENLSLLKPIITTIFAITLEVAITSIVEQILKKKTTLKTENSKEYKNIIAEINEKELELANVKEITSKLEKELTDSELKLNEKKAKLEELMENLILLKEEVIAKTMELPYNEEKNKPLTKKRTK